MEQLTNQLRKLGLNQSECTVYIFLLQNGRSLPPDVSRETGIARTNCYNILDTLQEKGLIEESVDGKRKAYLARSPEAIVQMLEEQRQAALRILPDLQAVYTVQKNKPVISYYSGWEEIRNIFYQSLEAKKVSFMGSITKMGPLSEAFFMYYRDEISKRGILYEEVIPKNSKNVSHETFSSVPQYSYATFPQNDPQLPTAVLIWDNFVALITTDDAPFATLLRNKAIFETFSTLFNTLKGVESVS